MARTLDTIVAAASGWTASPRGLVRVSGPETRELLSAILESPPAWERSACAVRVRLGQKASATVPAIELPAIALLAPGPRSFTGEDAAEILTVGNPAVLGRVVDALLGAGRGGVRLATPGEFSARAYMNGRLGLEEAEGLAATIAARSADDLAAARALMAGATGGRYRGWADEVLALLALVEAGIDFTDQDDVVAIAPSVLVRRCTLVRDAIAAELGGGAGVRRSGEPVCVLLGPPNAGKSTLFNALLGRRRAVVSPIAGTTRDVLRERLDLAGPAASPGAGALGVTLIDVAGLDESFAAAGGTDGAAQSAARDAVSNADVVIACDPQGRFDSLVRTPPERGAHVIRVRTKVDRVESGASGSADVVDVCAIDGRGVVELRRAIADAAWSGPRAQTAVVGGLPRHRRALTLAAGALDRAVDLGAGGHPELTAGALREALDVLGELTGRLSPDDVIGRIFATFCIGK